MSGMLAPFLSSLHINGLVTKLHEEKCGIECGGDKVPSLLFPDDTS